MNHWCPRMFVVLGLVGAAYGRAQDSVRVPVRVSSGAMAGQILERREMVYPPIARAARVSGAVILRVIIVESGHVANVLVVSGPQMLREAAVDAVRTWVYKPYLLNGVATPVDTTVTMSVQYGAEGVGNGASGTDREGSSQEKKAGIVGGVGEEPKVVTPPAASTFCGSSRIGEQGYHQRVSSGVMQGLLIKRVEPVFEKMDRLGDVVMMVCVDTDGAVERVRVISGPQFIRGEVGKAVSEWRYRPYLLNGVAVSVSTTVTIDFQQ